MPLSREDFVQLTRHLQAELREVDPEAQALVTEYTEQSDDSRRYFLDYLGSVIKVVSERSAGAHGRVLNLLNESVRTAEGGPVTGIRLELTGTERELYRRESIDLAQLPDRTEVVEALLALYHELFEEGGGEGIHNDAPRSDPED